MAKIERVPYRLGLICNGVIFITKPDTTGYFFEDSYPLGLPIEIVDFIKTHGRCINCKIRVNDDFSSCLCGHPKDERWHLEVEYPIELGDDLDSLLSREKNRLKSMRRQHRLSNNGGTVTKFEIEQLYILQEGICYFCGTEISIGSKKNAFHADHYNPLAYGGRNDIFNIVLTCQGCNLRKGTQYGDQFERSAKKLRPSDVGRKLGQIRRRINTHFKQKQK